jgi:predicted CXXCH cytochrome family protein
MKKVLVLLVVAAMAAPASALLIITNAHSTDLGCGACHTPHAAVTAGSDAPLWGNALDSLDGYTLYGGGDTITGTTRLCMTCHDGTMAGQVVTTTSVKDKTLSNMHPVSKAYPADSTPGYVDAGSIADTGIKDALAADGGNIECGVCHEIHASPTATPALRMATGTICTQCHSK